MDNSETFTALSTPHGESAIGIVRCSGQLCKSLASNIFGDHSPTPRLATVSNYKNQKGKFLDQVVYTYLEAEKSYTGDPMLEISCHGNPFVLQNILEDLVERGCRLAQPGEFTQTAFLNGKLDLSQAEAVVDLIKARTDLSFKAAAHQLKGSLSRRVNSLVEALLQIVAEIEAYIDFPEEDLPSEGDSAPCPKLSHLLNEISKLSDTAQTGIFLREGVQAIIVGKPNAGKSSILNRLLGEPRAIVSEEPGTTRDYIEASFFVNPYRINIIDTAGIYETEDLIGKEGIRKTLEQMALSDIIILTIDSSEPPPKFIPNVSKLLLPEKTLVIKNKSDLEPCPKLTGFMKGFPQVILSALKTTGFDQLKNEIRKLLGGPTASEKGDVIAVSARHHTALLKTEDDLKNALSLLESDKPAELVASHLREGIANLETIVGKIDNERMLDKLFAQFCIGK
tara:strand:+ start:2318 stop:3673 length:1356 start_codon:yes stop_codon:yes gene_type:complete